jgi:hypothetical protein
MSVSCQGPCLPNGITWEIVLILFMTFLNKASQELCVSSAPALTALMFDWSHETAAYFMASLGALVMPCGVFVNHMCKDREDRCNLVTFLVVVCVAGLMLVHLPLLPYSAPRYVLATVIFFVSLVNLEGVLMSLLTKLYSPQLASGTFNSGLLATEASTLGRVVSDMGLSVAMSFMAEGNSTAVVDVLFGPLVTVAAICVSVVVLRYQHFAI